MSESEPPVLQRQMETQAGVVVAGLLWFGALEWLIAQPMVGIWAMGLIMVLIITVAGIWLSIRGSRWLLMVHLFVVLVTSASALSFVTNLSWQHGVAAVAAGLVMAAFRQALEPVNAHLRGRLAAFVMTIVMLFGWVSILSVNIFTNLPTWWLMLFGAMLTTAVAAVMWAEAAVPWPRFRRWLPLWFLLGAEMSAVIWWLPTSITVGSVVATTMMMLFLQAARHFWLDTWSADRGRRYLAVGGTIVTLVLVTARWV